MHGVRAPVRLLRLPAPLPAFSCGGFRAGPDPRCLRSPRGAMSCRGLCYRHSAGAPCRGVTHGFRSPVRDCGGAFWFCGLGGVFRDWDFCLLCWHYYYYFKFSRLKEEAGNRENFGFPVATAALFARVGWGRGLPSPPHRPPSPQRGCGGREGPRQSPSPPPSRQGEGSVRRSFVRSLPRGAEKRRIKFF